MIAPEGYSTLATVFIVSAVIAWGGSYLGSAASWVVYGLLMLTFLLFVYFFRDPERSIPDNHDLIVAPADGKVVRIQKVRDERYLHGEGTQISIFLSPLDVHVNRVPVSGKLEYVEYFPGKFLMAWEDHASEQNERAHFGVRHPSGYKILFKQITGFMARRIVYHIREGDELKAGQRFGIMKFSSRMDLVLPPDIELRVQEGDRTVAGESIIGEIGP